MKNASDNDTSTVFLFDPDQMILGDIVLERGTSAGSKIVATVTGGQFSHALIWVGSDFVEAMPDGVRCLSFARVPVCVPDNWLLLRPKQQYIEIGKRAAAEARHLIFKQYDTEGAIRTVFGPRRGAIPKARFCSQLVAEAYSRAGLELVPGKRPEMVHPNMLAGISSHTPYVLPLIRSDKIQPGRYPVELLDRSAGYRASGMRGEFNIEQTVFAAVERLVADIPTPKRYRRGRPGSISDVLDLLPHLPFQSAQSIADALLQSMINEGYLYLLDGPMADIAIRVSKAERWQSQIPGWEMTRERHLENAEACGARNRLMPHRLWLTLQEMYLRNARAFEVVISKASGGVR